MTQLTNVQHTTDELMSCWRVQHQRIISFRRSSTSARERINESASCPRSNNKGRRAIGMTLGPISTSPAIQQSSFLLLFGWYDLQKEKEERKSFGQPEETFNAHREKESFFFSSTFYNIDSVVSCGWGYQSMTRLTGRTHVFLLFFFFCVSSCSLKKRSSNPLAEDQLDSPPLDPSFCRIDDFKGEGIERSWFQMTHSFLSNWSEQVDIEEEEGSKEPLATGFLLYKPYPIAFFNLFNKQGSCWIYRELILGRLIPACSTGWKKEGNSRHQNWLSFFFL